MAQWRGVDRNKPAIAHEMTCTGVKDHNPTELKIAVIIKSLSKETGSRLRVDQFWPKVLNLAREYFRCLNSEIFDPNLAACFSQYLRARCSANRISFGVG